MCITINIIEILIDINKMALLYWWQQGMVVVSSIVNIGDNDNGSNDAMVALETVPTVQETI